MLIALVAVFVAISITLTPALVTALVGTVIPWCVAFIAHADAPARLKRLLAGLIAVVAAVITQSTLTDGSAVLQLRTLALAVLAFLVQQITYSNLWKRLNLNRWRWLLPALGLGKPPNG
jgi:threonine/homoserine efflux transporter RhtA